jgi:hypothetical protein
VRKTEETSCVQEANEDDRLVPDFDNSKETFLRFDVNDKDKAGLELVPIDDIVDPEVDVVNNVES